MTNTVHLTCMNTVNKNSFIDYKMFSKSYQSHKKYIKEYKGILYEFYENNYYISQAQFKEGYAFIYMFQELH